MRIALLHLDLAAGPKERNDVMLLAAMEKAKARGADWIVTPETARDGYFFYKLEPRRLDAVSDRMAEELAAYISFAKKKQAVLFLSAAERDKETGLYYNTCFAIDEAGIRFGHRKMYSHQSGTEGGLSLGDAVDVYEGELRAGVLVCADAYYEKPAAELRQKKADLVIVSAAWPPGECCPRPVSVWEQTSLRAGCPVCICNQTGNHCGMDMTIGKSAVLDKGKLLFSYEGKPAVLLFDTDDSGNIVSRSFTVIPWEAKV